MKQTINLLDGKIYETSQILEPPYLEAHIIENKKDLPAVIVFPGGAYRGIAAHEGECIAKEFNSYGFHSFVLHYRTWPNCYPVPFLDAVSGVSHIKKIFKNIE